MKWTVIPILVLIAFSLAITGCLPLGDRQVTTPPAASGASTNVSSAPGNHPTSTTAAVSTEDTPAPTAVSFPFSCLPTTYPAESGLVTNIIDGDTIYVDIDGQEYSLRYIGIDAPEFDPYETGAEEAYRKNTELAAGQTVTLVRDVSNVDRYDRLLRYVLVGDTFINYELVLGGFAAAKEYWPDTACHDLFENGGGTMRSSSLVWLPAETAQLGDNAAMPSIQPTPPNTTGCPAGCLSEQNGCSIKGNISVDGEKIYHLPGMSFYEKTRINTDHGERWFCTEAEAAANGWRKAMR